MLIKAQQAGHGTGSTVVVRCPGCRQLGTFMTFPSVSDVHVPPNHYLGQRYCPNPACRAHVFFIMTGTQLQTTYPTERIDFDTTDIPQGVVECFEEALTCHANRCYIAAAIMVRKSLEALCKDRGATGANLKERIKALGTRVVLPVELLSALDDLRLLGNDAAHVESQEYDQVGQAELEAAIAVTKEVLKAVYQYSALLKQLRGLKKSP